MNSLAAARHRHAVGRLLHPAPVLRREQLRSELPGTVDALRRHRAEAVHRTGQEGLLDDSE